MKSLRVLISWSTFVLMAGLLLFSALVYAASEVLLQRFVDGRLLVLGETLAEFVERKPELFEHRDRDIAPTSELTQSPTDQHVLPDVTHALRVFSSRGSLVWRSPHASRLESLPPRILEQVRLKNILFETFKAPDGIPARHLFLFFVGKGGVQYVLQAETSLLHYQETLNGLVLLLALGSGATLFFAWIGSHWLSKKVLGPIDALCRGAETMSDTDLGKRLPMDSPYYEFRRLTQAVNAVLDQFQRGSEVQRNFCEIAAHEMKTPLTILQGNLEVALMKARTVDEYHEVLLNNLQQVERLIALTRPLLTLAKFTSSKPPVNLVPLVLEPLIQEIVDELALLADDRQIALRFETQPVPSVLGDTQWLKQALINLLDNALQYTPAGGSVTVRLQAVGREVAIAVEDTGHGIEPEHIPHLFERFYRTDWARAKDTAGTGLGLPIVKEIMEAHGGSIAVTSEVNKGSIFTLRLPALTQPALSA
ncbi:MAG: ATP-binding protein [Nitrospira sp.]|jgi:signal transduction histidine kinase|nr:ATP-binding protein [Nitrospira sp.]MDH4243418.1 ATP-binding protein [Nitrospira sp.]MDH4354997.1 ATP-binding protein [Nitrospira sp.]MDH5317017.1 ATP-binding protein [Nitrospira sp.]